MLKKIIVIILTLTPFAVQAETCAGSYGNKYFWGAGISKKGVNCTYRYCYYTCDYDSYPIFGRFIPASSLWKQDKKDHYSCYAKHDGDSNDCEFTTKRATN